jgi:flagellar assembly factor FliW
MEDLGLTEIGDAQVLVVVNKREDVLSANLQGPLVVNVTGRAGMQLVLADKKWSTRYELLRVAEAPEAISA